MSGTRHTSDKLVGPIQQSAWVCSGRCFLSGLFDDPSHWRGLAANNRNAAAQMVDPYSKRTLLLIAQRYDLMAERAQRRLEEAEKGEVA